MKSWFAFLYIYIFSEYIDPYFIFNFGLGLSTWAGSGLDLFGVLHFIAFSSFVGWYFFVYILWVLYAYFHYVVIIVWLVVYIMFV